MIPALRNAFTNATKRLSLTRIRTRSSKLECEIRSEETTTYYWYRELSVVGNCYARSTSVAGQGVAGVGQDAPARCGGVAGGVTGWQQDVAAGGLHRRRRSHGSGGRDGGVDRGPGAVGGGGGVVDATGGRGRRGGGRYGGSDQGGSRCIR
jgi:hypothetical protein